MNEELISKVSSGEVALVDVREKYEWNAGHADLAKHIPLTELESIEEAIDKDTPVVVYCRTGNRSQMAVRILESLGYKAYNLGGLDDWADLGGKIVSE